MAADKSIVEMTGQLLAKAQASEEEVDRWMSKCKRTFNRLEKERQKLKRARKALAAHMQAVEKLS